MPVKIELANVPDIIQKYLAGMTINQLAEENSVSISVIRDRLIKNDVPLRDIGEAWKLRQRPVDESLVAQRYIKGESCKAIATQFGVDRARIYSILKTHGIKTRSQSEAERLKWATMKQDRRRVERQCSSAWAAAKGRERSLAEKIKNARTRYRNVTHCGAHEKVIFDLLKEKGVDVVQQFPVRNYNIDIAVPTHRIAIEIVNANWSIKNASSVPHRVEHILNRGWTLIFVVFNPRGARQTDYIGITNQLHTLIQLRCTDKPTAGQYGVIWCDGQPSTRHGRYFKHFPYMFTSSSSNKIA